MVHSHPGFVAHLGSEQGFFINLSPDKIITPPSGESLRQFGLVFFTSRVFLLTLFLAVNQITPQQSIMDDLKQIPSIQGKWVVFMKAVFGAQGRRQSHLNKTGAAHGIQQTLPGHKEKR